MYQTIVNIDSNSFHFGAKQILENILATVPFTKYNPASFIGVDWSWI